MKRFYKAVTVEKSDGSFQIQLDQRAIKTAAGNAQILPTQQLAAALAEEWDKQGEEIDPALFRYRDLADYAIDLVAPDIDGTVATILHFIETDTLCYRADPEEHLFGKQQEVWEPVLSAFETRHGITLQRISGIIHQPQSPDTHAILSAKLSAMDEFSLSSLQAMTSLAASLSVGLSALESDAEPIELWNAANLEEDWQIEQWGQDAEAEAVRAKRQSDFINAWNFGRLASG